MHHSSIHLYIKDQTIVNRISSKLVNSKIIYVDVDFCVVLHEYPRVIHQTRLFLQVLDPKPWA